MAAQRQALPARAGFGGQNHQTPNPPLGPESRKCGQRPHLSGAHDVGRVLALQNLMYYLDNAQSVDIYNNLLCQFLEMSQSGD